MQLLHEKFIKAVRGLSYPIVVTLLVLGACSPEQKPGQAVTTDSFSLNCHNTAVDPDSIPATIPYRVVKRYAHSPEAFTQGLDYRDGLLYESTGLYGRSSIAVYRLGETTPLQQQKLAQQFFGEGATLVGNQVLQLTWKSGKVFRYELPGLEPVDEYTIDGEGWGITYSGQQLVTSDGSSTLRFRSPEDLAESSTLVARYAGRPLKNLNELEWIDGCILANIWQSDSIAAIDANNGETVYTIDVSALAAPEKKRNPQHVANGVAWREDNGHLLVTGKNWHWLYELELLAPKPQ